jgi:hypothetical protein
MVDLLVGLVGRLAGEAALLGCMHGAQRWAEAAE